MGRINIVLKQFKGNEMKNNEIIHIANESFKVKKLEDDDVIIVDRHIKAFNINQPKSDFETSYADAKKNKDFSTSQGTINVSVRGVYADGSGYPIRFDKNNQAFGLHKIDDAY